jgi:hypothetical protein
MIPTWIEWSVIAVALLSLTAIMLAVILITLSIVRARRADNPAKQLHRMGARLTSSSDREHARIGFLLISHAHSLGPESCRCPLPAVTFHSSRNEKDGED